MKFLKTLFITGVQSHYDDKLTKRIILTNQFGFVAFVVFFISALHDYILGDIWAAVISGLFTVPCLSVFLLNRMHWHKYVASFHLIYCNIAIFYFDSYSGIPTGIYLYYFPLMLAIAFVFDYKEKKLMLFHFFLPALFLMVNILTHHHLFKNEGLTDSDKAAIFLINLILSVSSVGFFMYLTFINNMEESAVFEQRINERKAIETALKEALKVKNVLLAEVHHRVKNNLAIITGLFNLQMDAIENVEAKNFLIDSKNRVKSMALIHDSLYHSENLSEIDFTTYTKELIREIQHSFPLISKKISVNTTLSDITLTVNSAIPCGLILNELLTNCFKHAFVGRERGNINVSFSKVKNMLKLIVRDDGVGLKDGYENTDSLGMGVIHSLSDQLDGKCKFTRDNGTCFELEFEQV